MIIGLVGFAGSGKSTAGQILREEHGFESIAFADPLKDVVSNIFGWDRKLLEGDTADSRIFRETEDRWWSDRLGFKITPRLMFQMIGTECVRKGLSEKTWLCALERRIPKDKNIVVTDCRYSNEIDMLRNLGANIIWIKRGPFPTPEEMNLMHSSEIEWTWKKVNYEIENDKTIDDLRAGIKTVLTDISKSYNIFHHQV